MPGYTSAIDKLKKELALLEAKQEEFEAQSTCCKLAEVLHHKLC